MGQVRAFLRRSLRAAGCFLLSSFAVLVLVEGLSSVIYFCGRLVRDRALAEERYTRYDPDLGWSSQPNLDLPDLYGPGLSLRTNSQGFRNDHDFPPRVPEGKLRAICLGDSFTLGYGVAGKDTWCQALTTLVPGLETVNMGQGGYGVDQAFLWYRRDGAVLEHQAQLFSFITHDFVRMGSNEFIGYGKPLLQLRQGKLEVTNVPVPKPRFLLTWLRGHRFYINNLASVRLVDAVVSELRQDAPPATDEMASRNLAGRLFDELLALNRAKGSRLTLIYLPGPTDYGSCESDQWRSFVSQKAQQLGIPFLDLVAEQRKLPPEEVGRFYIRSPEARYFGAVGHYTREGNAWVARQIAARRAEL